MLIKIPATQLGGSEIGYAIMSNIIIYACFLHIAFAYNIIFGDRGLYKKKCGRSMTYRMPVTCPKQLERGILHV